MVKNSYEQELKEEIKKSEKEFIKKAEKRGEKLTTEEIINRSAKQISHFMENFWLYNKLLAESELKGYRKAKTNFLKLIKEIKESKELRNRYDNKTIQNICGYLEGEIKDAKK